MSNQFHTPLLSNDLSFISDRFFQSHSHNLPSWLLLLLVGVLSCTLPNVARAQSAPLTNPATIAAQEQLRQQERERVQRQQQEVRPDVRLTTPFTSTTDAQESEDNEILPSDEIPCFNIRSISLIGEASERFQWLLNHVDHTANGTEDIAIGRCLGAHGINVLLHRLQAALTQQGWVTTRVLMKPQELTTGDLQISLLPGRLGQIRLVPDAQGKIPEHVNLNMAFPLQSGDILNLYELEQGLENLRRVPGQKISLDNNTYLYSDSSEFYENSHIDIEQLANTLSISLKDSTNVLYRRYGISLAPPDVGCNNDYLVFRWANTVGSAEGALGSAFATEKKFRKLPNGSLEIHITTREWYYSSSVGLIGIGTDGHASGTEPRHVDKVLIFSPIN